MQRDGGPGGAGGAGNPTGGSFTGPAQALELIGDKSGENRFAYAYSGGIQLANETKTALDFTTGNYLTVAQIQHTGRFALFGSSKTMEMIISMNGTQIVRMSRLTNSAHGAIDFDPIYITIPPYTEVKVEVYTDDTQDLENFVTLTGRIYQG